MEKYIGKTIGSRYEIQEICGIGGMAVVYKAFDTQTQKNVAVKIMKDEFLRNEEFCRRFRNESKAVSALNHRNIVKILDVSLTDEMQYIVMELVDGITLKGYIDQKGEIPWNEAVHFTIQVLRALQHAHGKGIIHRDIKPQNIMLLENGMIKIADFGIARFSGSETRTITDKAIGSVHYISPEQAKGEKTDMRTDIYSAGVMLYEMMTGKLPFDADNPVSVALMQLQNDPILPRERNEEIPLGLEQIIMKAMRKEPSQRYQSAAAMLRDVEDFKRDPQIKFSYEYFVDESPTRYIDTIDTIKTKDDDDDEDMQHRKKSSVVSAMTGIVLSFVVVAVVFALITFALNDIFPRTYKEVELPNFVGMNFSDVVSDNRYQFEFTKEEEFSEVPIGEIIRQSPSGEKTVYENSIITLYVSKGKERLDVPNIVGKYFNEGAQELTAVNLRVNRIDVYDDELPEEYIIAISPEAETEVLSNSVIDVYVSQGKKPSELEMPDCVNKMTFTQAKEKIIRMGLTLDTPEEVDSEKPKGTIISQTPAAGEKVEKGDSVKFVISNGSIEPKTIKLEIEMPNGIEKRLSIEIIQDGITVETSSVLPTITRVYEYTLSGGGMSKVRVLLDGKDYMEYSVNFDNKTIKVDKSYMFEL